MGKLVKIVVTVPVENADDVRKALADAGAGEIGDYVNCSFSSRGVGRFLPGPNASPHIGEPGTPEEVEEERIEVTCERSKAAAAIDAAREAHPYEEPVFDVYALLDPLEL